MPPGIVPIGLKLLPNQGKEVGPTGAVLAVEVCKAIIDAVKSGDKDKFTLEMMKFNVDVRDVVDSS